MNILHITDLHFGTDRSVAQHDERHLALEELIVTVKGLDPSWAPSVVCVSGDLAFAGRPSDYSQFVDWIKRLLAALNLGVERLVVCPGNHDIERAVATTFARPGTPEEADRCLSVPLAAHYEKAFQNYTEFCKALGIPSLAFGDQESYLTGVRVLDGVRFVSMNSSWFCRDNTDHQQLWIGIPLLRHLEASNQWPKQGIPCIGLLHHPREDFNPQEIHAYGNRPNVYDYICERCDILLSGHTHGEVREPDQIAGRALVFTGGATYVGSNYNNSFQILRLQGISLDYRAFVFDPRKRNWSSAGEAKHRRLGSLAASSSLDAPAPVPIEDWRSNAAGDARRVRDSKSRAASPSGNLPPLIQRGVTILRVETKGLSPEQAKVPDRSESFPLYNAVRTTPGRKVLLLGDIGSGKSTLVCEFVERSLSENPASLSFIVPASSLSVSPNLTLKALLGQVSAYFSEQIAPTSYALDVKSVLGQGTEVTLAIDGLDEMSVSSASLLLSKLATATEHWSNLQIVATSRPIELQGIDYQTWNVLSTLSVNAAERRELLQNELTSLGSTRKISEEADELESQIARSETVSALFSSPLTIRLFTPVLRKSGVSATVTLGELLLDVLNERLSGWDQRDLKPHQFSALEAALPSADSRLRLLGEALASTPEESDTRRDAFISRFEASSTLGANPAKRAVAKEAFDSFVLAGILSNASVVSFPLQAFREMCVACWLVQKLEEGSDQEIMGSRWRDVSFAAAVLRRSNSFSKYRDIFERYIASLLRDVSGVLAAASVVLESQDQDLALSFIEGLKKLGQHPFNRSGGIDRDDSSKAVAASIRLARNAGFDWFFSEYLDPRYPVRFAGSAILDWVFAEWLAQVRNTLTVDQLDKLKTLARPHVDASTFQVHGIIARLSTVVPEAFSSEERVYFASTLLEDMRYRAHALEAIDREFASDPANTESLLIGRINQGFNDGGLIAAILIDRQPGVPPVDLIRAVLRSSTSSRVNKTIEAALATIKDRLTEPTWLRLLRWLTFDSDRSVAASAAIFANDIEPQPSALIRKPLLDALHDGAYVWRAEPLLRKAVDEGGTGQVHWLANEIAHADRMMGGHSGWWRIFLANLEKSGTDAPVVLADALGGLGPFLLARNPEIRQRFKALLQGAHGDAYRTELRSQLDAVDPRVRLAAAAILTTCDPKGEARALRVAVRAQDEWRTHDWHEWFDMALTFSYGPGPLTALEAELPRFGDSAKNYAFRLLFQNDTGIETRQPDALVHALLSFYSTTDKEHAFLLSSRGRLETALASHDADRTKRAAALLLELGQLSLESEARAWIAMAEASLTVGVHCSGGLLLTATASDGSGYTLTGAQGPAPAGQLADRGGRVIAAPLNTTSGAATMTDANGNELTVNSSGQFFDTLSASTPVLTVSGSGTPSSPTTFTYAAHSGNVAYKMNYTQYTVQTAFGFGSTIQEYGPTSVPLVSSVSLPDGSKYSFTYESGPGSCVLKSGTTSCVTGRIIKVTLPSGGTITYTYSGGTKGTGIYSDGSTAALTRALNPGSGSWSYSRALVAGTPGPGSMWTTSITDPVGNATAISFAEDSTTTTPTTTATYNLYETQRLVYQGSTSGTLLSTNIACYNGNSIGTPSSCHTTAVGTPINRLTRFNYIPNSSGQQSETDTDYVPYTTLPTNVYSYDFGGVGNSVGPLLRRVFITYANLSNGIIDHPSVVNVYDGGANLKARATYTYDEGTVTPSGATQLQSITGSRGNLTTLAVQANSTTTLYRKFTYYDSGTLNTSTDVSTSNTTSGPTTTYAYGSTTASCDFAFPTSVSITQPISMSSTSTWNCTGGVATQTKDVNLEPTGFTYTDPNYWRLTSTSFPDGGSSSATYNFGKTSPWNITTSIAKDSTTNVTGETILDGFGRALHTQSTDVGGKIDYVDTVYDALGRVASVSNPYQTTSDPTYGLTKYSYDALNRITLITHPDSTKATYNYSGAATQVIDEGSNSGGTTKVQKVYQSDGLGRTASVCEVSGATQLGGTSGTPAACGQDIGETGFLTSYGYDALGNLTSVTQGSLSRSYAYDSLSRLTQEINPESGTTNYTYDTVTAGDLYQRTRPKPNQTGSAIVTTTYSYDALHRLTNLTYSDSTPGAGYYYDQSSPWGVSAQNPKGRVTQAQTDNGVVVAGAVFSYDAMGRVIGEWECTPLQCGSGSISLTNAYDYLGDVTSRSNGFDNVTYTYTYDTLARLTQLTSSLNDPNHPGTLVTVNSYNPLGEITKATLGNGIVRTLGYDDRGRLTSLADGSIYNFSLGYAPDSDIVTGNDSTNGSWSYTYDDFNRVSASNKNSGAQTFSYAYDRYSNRWQQNAPQGGPAPQYTFNNNNQITTSGVSYDAAGNITADGLGNTYTYDAENRVITVGGNNSATYVYDAFGRRVRTVINGTAYDFLYNGNNIVDEIQGSTWVWGDAGGLQAAAYANSTTYFNHSDWLGTTRAWSNVSGAAVGSCTSLAFGDAQTCSGTMPTPWHYTGLQADAETGLSHTLYRQLSTTQGRWTAADPGGLGSVDPANPQSWNRYSYAANNPLNYVDPLGLYRDGPGQCSIAGDSCYGGGNPGGGGGGGVFCDASGNCGSSTGVTGDLQGINGVPWTFGPGYIGTTAFGIGPLQQAFAQYLAFYVDGELDYSESNVDTSNSGVANSAQGQCSAKIQSAVEKDLNPTSIINLGPYNLPPMDSSGMRGGAYNVNFFATGVPFGPIGTASAVPGTTCGRFSDGLHIPIPGAPGCPNLSDPTLFTGQPDFLYGLSGFYFTAHIDSGNANGFSGSVKHVIIDVILGNLGYHHGC